MRTFEQLQQFLWIAGQYRAIRAERPTVAARDVLEFVKSDEYSCFDEFFCARTIGHEWAYDDMDRCYCLNCGADGDA